MINVYNLLAESFYDLLEDVLRDGHTQYWLKGGRASTKSSCISIIIPLCMMLDAQKGIHSNAVVLRKVADTLKTSVYSTMLWAIDMLGVNEYWSAKTSPMQLTYLPTGQQILFRGCDDPRKLKSIKFVEGYCKYIWYEELDEFYGMEEIRNINQSLMRGGDNIKVFFSYNPPKVISNWVNDEAQKEMPSRLVHHSTYLDVPIEWLSKEFVAEAEYLKETNELYYRNEYLGEITGTGGQVFENLTFREITDDEVKRFDRIVDGIDFGFAIDPVCYLQAHYDKTRRRIYIFNEIYKVGMSNKQLADEIKQKKVGTSYITCDSAEPKSISELQSYGLRVKGAKKGPDSIDYGIKFLQKQAEIIIDKTRCPNIAREFRNYEYEQDKNGNFKSQYPDKDNHSIDSLRYAMEDYTLSNTWALSGKKLI